MSSEDWCNYIYILPKSQESPIGVATSYGLCGKGVRVGTMVETAILSSPRSSDKL
jgi:hypothetical protein